MTRHRACRASHALLATYFSSVGGRGSPAIREAKLVSPHDETSGGRHSDLRALSRSVLH